MSAQSKNGAIVLLAFENKKQIDFSKIENTAATLATFGYYCDKISRVAYDNKNEIINAIRDGVDNFDNILLLCPEKMRGMLGDFTSQLTGGRFDGLGILNSGKKSVFIVSSDGENRLRYEDIKKTLDEKYGIKYDSSVIKVVGAPQKLINEALAQAAEAFPDGGITFNVKNVYDDIRIEIVYSSHTPKMQLDEAQRVIIKKLNEFVYALEDISLAEQLYRLLKLRRMKIAVAESFTGGGIGKRLVDVSGISEVYNEGLNTYSNQAKMERLGVSELTLNQRGAVSAETAYQMAEGLLNAGNCEVAISSTGIAGPKSDNTLKPVGLAYIGVGVGSDIAVYKFNFTGDRQAITEKGINHALFLAYKRLK